MTEGGLAGICEARGMICSLQSSLFQGGLLGSFFMVSVLVQGLDMSACLSLVGCLPFVFPLSLLVQADIAATEEEIILYLN